MISKNLKKRFFTSITLITLIFIRFYDFLLVYGLIILGVISILVFNLMEKINCQKFLKFYWYNFYLYLLFLCAIHIFS